jgi:hypothetical protein
MQFRRRLIPFEQVANFGIVVQQPFDQLGVVPRPAGGGVIASSSWPVVFRRP